MRSQESLRQSVIVLNLTLAIPLTTLGPNCIGPNPCLSLGKYRRCGERMLFSWATDGFPPRSTIGFSALQDGQMPLAFTLFLLPLLLLLLLIIIIVNNNNDSYNYNQYSTSSPLFCFCFVFPQLIQFGLVWFLCLMAYQPLQVI